MAYHHPSSIARSAIQVFERISLLANRRAQPVIFTAWVTTSISPLRRIDANSRDSPFCFTAASTTSLSSLYFIGKSRSIPQDSLIILITLPVLNSSFSISCAHIGLEIDNNKSSKTIILNIKKEIINSLPPLPSPPSSSLRVLYS